MIYGVRPGALLASDAPEAIRARIEVVEPTDDELYAHVVAGGVRLHVAFAGRPILAINDPIVLAPRPGGVHLFDADTGRRLEQG